MIPLTRPARRAEDRCERTACWCHHRNTAAAGATAFRWTPELPALRFTTTTTGRQVRP